MPPRTVRYTCFVSPACGSIFQLMCRICRCWGPWQAGENSGMQGAEQETSKSTRLAACACKTGKTGAAAKLSGYAVKPAHQPVRFNHYKKYSGVHALPRCTSVSQSVPGLTPGQWRAACPSAGASGGRPGRTCGQSWWGPAEEEKRCRGIDEEKGEA